MNNGNIINESSLEKFKQARKMLYPELSVKIEDSQFRAEYYRPMEKAISRQCEEHLNKFIDEMWKKVLEAKNGNN